MAERKITKFEDTLNPRPWPIRKMPTYEELYGKETGADRAYSDFMEENVHVRHAYRKPYQLEDVRVLDCSIWRKAPAACTSMLAELGAEVIKIEPLEGDPWRRLSPFGREEYMAEDSFTGEKVGLDFLNECRNKFCVTLNFETEEGREILKKMASQSDVLVENYPPGQFDEWGIGYRQLSKLNPKLIYIYVGQIGQWGSSKDRVSKFGQWMLGPFDACASEFVHSTGYPADQLPRERGGNPTRSGEWNGAWPGAEHSFVAIIAALFVRDGVAGTNIGKGQYLEVANSEAYMELCDFNVSWYGFDGSIKARSGGWDPNLNQYAWNPCADGFMMIGGQSDRLWYRIVQCIERDYPTYGRLVGEDPIEKEMGARNQLEMLCKTYTLTSYWLARNPRAFAERKLLEYGIAAGPLLYVDEVAEYPDFIYRGHVQMFEDEHYGSILLARPPLGHQHRAPARIRWLGRPIGWDNSQVYARLLGYGPDTLNELKEKGVI